MRGERPSSGQRTHDAPLAFGGLMHIAALSPEQQRELLALAERELAQRSLLAFCNRAYPGYLAPAHLRLLIEHLEKLECGEIKSLAVFMPPRHGKSLTAAQLFPAWFLGRHPRKHVLLTSYNQDLANTVSRKVRDTVSDESWPFPDAKLRDDSRSVENWDLNRGGGLIAAGIGGSITGKGADLLVLDDVIKSKDDIDTLEKRDKLWEWYSEVAYTRLMPGGKVLYITTRWGDDDLAGRAVASTDEWTVLRLSAIAEIGDVLGREPGTALWPSAYPIERLEKIREVQGSRSFQALYQQNPTPADGTAFKAEWLSHRYDEIPNREAFVPAKGPFTLPGTMRVVQRPPIVLQAVDASWGASTSSDYSAIATVMYDFVNFYVADVWRGRVPHPELVRMIEAKYQQYRPRTVIIEKAQAGWAAIQSLQVLNRIPVYGIVPRSSKESRVDAIISLFEAGRVFFPRNASWLDFTIAELVKFPNGSTDDVTDAITYCLNAICEGVKVHLVNTDRPHLRSLLTGSAIA